MKNRNGKRLLGLLFAAALVMGCAFCAAAACEHSYSDNVCTLCGQIGGTWGTGGTWSFAPESGTVTVTGTGAMPDYSATNKAPWNSLGEALVNVVIEEGVTHLGSYSFHKCSGLENVKLPSSLKTLGRDAFHLCTSLKEITLDFTPEEEKGK